VALPLKWARRASYAHGRGDLLGVDPLKVDERRAEVGGAERQGVLVAPAFRRERARGRLKSGAPAWDDFRNSRTLGAQKATRVATVVRSRHVGLGYIDARLRTRKEQPVRDAWQMRLPGNRAGRVRSQAAVRVAIRAEPRLSSRQRQALLEVYDAR
jgi:hypothetical protein